MNVVSKFGCKQFEVSYQGSLGGSPRWRRDQGNFVKWSFRLTYFNHVINHVIWKGSPDSLWIVHNGRRK